MTVRTLKLENDSTRALPDGWQAAAEAALQIGLSHVAAAWSQRIWHITDALHTQGFRFKLVDELPDAPGALAYHDVDDSGRPYINVGLKPIFDNGGDWFVGPMSVVSVIDHETKELVGDPACNLWANDAEGVTWARELCDPVESDVYTVTTDAGPPCTLSNFVLPAWFEPLDARGPYDFMQVCTRPFEIAKGGYAIKQTPGSVTEVFSEGYPEWKLKLKHRGAERARWGNKQVRVDL
jgi:hypothetical protein